MLFMILDTRKGVCCPIPCGLHQGHSLVVPVEAPFGLMVLLFLSGTNN